MDAQTLIILIPYLPLAVTTGSWMATCKASLSDPCCSWASSTDELFLEQNTSETICLLTGRHVTGLICVPLLLVAAMFKQQALLKFKDIWYVIFQHSDVLQTLPVSSYIFLLQSPLAVEWRQEKHHFSDACCLRTSSADGIFLERNASVLIALFIIAIE